jgi:hypothetical protein
MSRRTRSCKSAYTKPAIPLFESLIQLRNSSLVRTLAPAFRSIASPQMTVEPIKDDEENQTHLKPSVLERDAYLHCAQCCYVMIDRKPVFSSLAKPSRGLAENGSRAASRHASETKIAANS